VHGANRLASNSLLEGLVFGARAAGVMQQPPGAAALKRDRVVVPCVPVAPAPGIGPGRPLTMTDVRDLMWRDAGLFRSHERLDSAVRHLDAAYAASCRDADVSAFSSDQWRTYNLITVARLIARAALRREESRGGHFRADFPARDDLHWKVHLCDTT
jgi:L-aspartate oxidase